MNTIEIDTLRGVITLYGQRYNLGLFEHLGFGPVGAIFRVAARADGELILQRLDLPIRESLADITLERERQVTEEGYVPEHDDRYVSDELAVAAACYCLAPIHMMPMLRRTESDGEAYEVPRLWPWHSRWWKPAVPRTASVLGERRRQLVKAGALIAAEIERIDRLRK